MTSLYQRWSFHPKMLLQKGSQALWRTSTLYVLLHLVSAVKALNHQSAGAQEGGRPSGNRKVTGLIPGSSTDRVH